MQCGVVRCRAAGQCTVVVASQLVSVYLYAGTTYVPAKRSGSIAGALSHTLSFSPSIGPEQGHEKRLINRTNTVTFLPRDMYRNERTSSLSRVPHPASAHLCSRALVRSRTRERTSGTEKKSASTIAESSTDLFRLR